MSETETTSDRKVSSSSTELHGGRPPKGLGRPDHVAGGFGHESLKDAIERLEASGRSNRERNFLRVRRPSAPVDPIFSEALADVAKQYAKRLYEKTNDPAGSSRNCQNGGEVDPDIFLEEIARWFLRKGLADEIAEVTRTLSRRRESEAVQYLVSELHPFLAFELVSAKPPEADPEDAQGFAEAELYLLAKPDDGAIELMSLSLIDNIAKRNRIQVSPQLRRVWAASLRRFF